MSLLKNVAWSDSSDPVFGAARYIAMHMPPLGQPDRFGGSQGGFDALKAKMKATQTYA